jgi:GNAT superfamily N-acetyltransferase
MTVSIRQATPADAATIVDFNRRMALETEDKVLDPQVLAAGVAGALADAHKAVYFVAEEDRHILGQVSVTLEWSDWRNGWLWWFQSVYVRPEARRRGVFKALYEHVYQAACADPQVIGLRLYVEKENHPAQQTYLRLGMEWTPYLMLQKFPL